MQLGFATELNVGSSLVPEMPYFHNKYIKELKEMQIHLNLNTDWGNSFSLRSYMFATWSPCLTHLLLVSHFVYLIQTHLSCWEKRQNSLEWDWGLGGYSGKQSWANVTCITVNSVSQKSQESICFRDFTSIIELPQKSQEKKNQFNFLFPTQK